MPGTYYIDYNVIDSELNPALTVTRTIIVADRTAPVLTPRGSGASEDVRRNEVYTELDADWTDVIDGSGTAFASGIVDTNVLGSYPVTYEHIDAAGNVGSATRTVNVVT